MIKKLQILWYLKKEDFTNYCIDFKPYSSKLIKGYEIADVDEDLIYDLCDKNPEELEIIGYFQSENELKKYLRDYITSEEYELEINSQELEDKITTAMNTLNWTGEDYYMSYGSHSIGSSLNKISNWFSILTEEYKSNLSIWVQWVTTYNVYDIAPTGKALTYVLSDILNLPESYFKEIIPNKNRLTKEEWNNILKKIYKKNHLDLGLCRAI
jgi:hypothetical protein